MKSIHATLLSTALYVENPLGIPVKDDHYDLFSEYMIGQYANDDGTSPAIALYNEFIKYFGVAQDLSKTLESCKAAYDVYRNSVLNQFSTFCGM